ncbi:uncharacterized protein LOC142620259 [Castanea sativa]|uniref:uncharacterized protein LOC142620259 n=1 Tax=Castanea sativa TaxID=21020 RepID=UPI003F649E13
MPVEAVLEKPVCEKLEEIVIDDDPEKFFQVGVQLPPQEKEELVIFLKRNIDIFAWNAYEAFEVNPNFICHHLNVNPAVLPKKQRPQHLSKVHSDAVKVEVNKLKQARDYQRSVLLRVVGQYNEFSGRLSSISPNTFGFRLDDQEKTTFVTPIGNYHYKVMPFGLKNARSTYQRMITRMFEPQLGKNIKIYIDDMVVKSKIEFRHVGDLENVFEILRKHNLRHNASKCSFSVGSGKFLGCRPFFQLLNKSKGFEWTEECVLAFQKLKEYLSRPPIMSSPEVDEVLFAYIVVASHAVSLVLIRIDNSVQRLVIMCQVITGSRSSLLTHGKGHFGSSACQT